MVEKIIYELTKQTSYFKGIYYTNVFISILSLVFFSSVGHFENSEPNSILKNTIGIITLSTTLTVSVAVIYSVIIFNRLIVRYYIKNSREITYLFPGGRTTVFSSKLYALCSHFLISLFPTLLFVNTIFYFLTNYSILVKINLFEELIRIVTVVNFSSIFSLLLVLISLFIGLILQSTNSSIISSVLVVSIVGNLIAQLYQIDSLTIIILSLIMAIFDYMMLKRLRDYVKKDDIINNVIKNED